MDNIVTSNLAEFGYRERVMAEEILSAWNKNGLPNDFLDDEVVIMMNKNSGNVFLTNSEYQVAMLNGEELESFYSCPICGHEGFLTEMEHGKDNIECLEYVKEINNY